MIEREERREREREREREGERGERENLPSTRHSAALSILGESICSSFVLLPTNTKP